MLRVQGFRFRVWCLGLSVVQSGLGSSTAGTSTLIYWTAYLRVAVTETTAAGVTLLDDHYEPLEDDLKDLGKFEGTQGFQK